MYWLESIISISLEQGLAYCLATVGIAISFRLLAFPDLTVDGSFTIGGALGAVLLVGGCDPLLALILILLTGSIVGICTASLHNHVGISRLLSGILSMIILYSINLRIMGRSNISLLGTGTLLTWIEEVPSPYFARAPVIGFFAGMTCCVVLAVHLFFRTELGAYVRATGENLQVVKSMAVNPKTTIAIGLAISNALVALSGFIVAQNQGFADIGMGFGIIISGLAALIIGETLLQPTSTFGLVIAAIIGSVLYQMFIAVALRFGLAASDLKMVTGLLVVVVLFARRLLARVRGIQEDESGQIGSTGL